MQTFHSALNFRDFGGYATKDGKKVIHHQIFRSGGLYLLKPEEYNLFHTYHIQSILDLRTKEEATSLPDPTFENVIYMQHSGVVSTGGEDIDFSPTGMFQTGRKGQAQFNALQQYYRLMPFHNEAFHLLFDALQNHKTPIVFHCASGKDRTGVAAMLVLLALGVDEETVLEDYMLSNTYRKSFLNQTFAQYETEIQNDPTLKKLLTMKDGVLYEIGKSVLDEIKSRYDSYEQYFYDEFHFTKETLQEFRNYYTEL